MTIEVTRESEDRLRDRYWSFSVTKGYSGPSDEVRVTLEYFAERERPTTRHKMKVAGNGRRQWSRMEQRPYFSGISGDEVPLPDDVRDEAVSKVKVVVVGTKDTP